MRIITCFYFSAMMLLIIAPNSKAEILNVTASFTPSLWMPDNNKFTNTTPQSGYCVRYPDECKNGDVSLGTGLVLKPSRSLTVNDNPRDSLYFKLPSSFREVEVSNGTSKATVSFRINALSARYTAAKNHGVYDWKNVQFFSEPTGGCVYRAPGWIGGSYAWWLWSYPEGVGGCYNITSTDRPEGDDKYINGVDGISLGYELKTPNPLSMESGIYTGTLRFDVGPGMDIDFGDNFQASDSTLTINFSLSVNHELKINTNIEERKISLQPCDKDKKCTEEQGKANWERWMINRITPELTGKSIFSISSSGSFTTYLQCEYQIGDNCSIKGDDSKENIPVQTLLTLPNNIVDKNSGGVVSRKRIGIGKDINRNIFETKEFGQDKSGYIDFLIIKQDVDRMLSTRPDTYRGAVTVIFDSHIY
ncbi:hypothetical protein [Enterobacter hormaechei]|uniref:hypothetical protein n=1 Tax=Enterobacter hormaechei TaxID=158836 RepID=UPI0012B7EDEF|nr:hypothetical protein [Enterobacter hormaechei]MBT2053146.1 hypothetical protein [Enterobacter hormaechei subsp. hoffmannii]MCU2452614.1 hypothetical protein [Enterobacter hormaechei subsp. hoffmannii]MCW4743723.1 hypothetical protein [Enterobacter hormaechei subsp. hoffmannii]